jgi:hypothetical protein
METYDCITIVENTREKTTWILKKLNMKVLRVIRLKIRASNGFL